MAENMELDGQAFVESVVAAIQVFRATHRSEAGLRLVMSEATWQAAGAAIAPEMRYWRRPQDEEGLLGVRVKFRPGMAFGQFLLIQGDVGGG